MAVSATGSDFSYLFPPLIRKADPDGRALAQGAVQVDAGVVEGGGVFDDGQPQAGAADLAGVAFVHPVESARIPGPGPGPGCPMPVSATSEDGLVFPGSTETVTEPPV